MLDLEIFLNNLEVFFLILRTCFDNFWQERDMLFVAYGLYRVEVGSFLGGIPTEEHSGDGTYGEGEEYAPGWI